MIFPKTETRLNNLDEEADNEMDYAIHVHVDGGVPLVNQQVHRLAAEFVFVPKNQV